MFEPRLLKVACPHCGAGLKINPQAAVVTCSYCQQSSFIHIPNRAEPPAPSGTQRYGHIHVPAAKATKAATLALALAFLIPILFAGGVVIAILAPVVGLGKSRPPPPSTRAGADHGNASADACNKAVACCKAVLDSVPGQPPNLRTCEALRALSDADCKKQHDTFRNSAKQLGQTCD